MPARKAAAGLLPLRWSALPPINNASASAWRRPREGKIGDLGARSGSPGSGSTRTGWRRGCCRRHSSPLPRTTSKVTRSAAARTELATAVLQAVVLAGEEFGLLWNPLLLSTDH
jgi:hypothetical protein